MQQPLTETLNEEMARVAARLSAMRKVLEIKPRNDETIKLIECIEEAEAALQRAADCLSAMSAFLRTLGASSA
jgi:hypothetical protein